MVSWGLKVSKRTLSTKDGTHSWDDAQEGDVVCVNDERFEVRRWVPGTGLCVEGSLDGQVMNVPLYHVRAMGAHLERDVEEHPNGVVPNEPMLHVVFGNGEHAMNLARGYNRPWAVPLGGGDWAWMTHAQVQALADEHGFVRLVPEIEVETARVEGWKQGIREASSLVTLYALGDRYSTERMYANERIQGAFPEAFTQDGGEQA